MQHFKRFDTWHKTRTGHAVFAVVELLIAYIIGSRALDTGSWWEYGFTFFFLVGAVQNSVHLLRKK